MLKNHIKTAWRHTFRNKAYSALNIGGLAVGLAVAMLIGLWIYDEFSYNKYHQNYDHIAQVLQNGTYNGVVSTQEQNPMPLGNELRTIYGNDFKYVVMASGTRPFTLMSGLKKFTESGGFFEPEVTDMLTLKMLKGTRAGLKRPNFHFTFSESVAEAVFGNTDPMGKLLKIDNTHQVKVTGVYEDLPANSKFSDLAFMAPWQLYLREETEEHKADWSYNSFQTYVQLAEQADMDRISAKIKNVKRDKVSKEEAKYKPEMFLHPMRKWHLYSEFENGVSVGGRIHFVRLFGIIGGFVLLLACINFMNLATARAEKRAKEVGIRKAIGSVRGQLISQFFCESLLVVALAFIAALFLMQLMLPFFNEVADKKITILSTNSSFWLLSIGFCLLTGLIAGSYPAFYLSSFQPINALKGTFRVGRFATIPRQVLVVLQFSVSIALIIGTITVFRQIQFAKNRPIGYNQSGLIMMRTPTSDIHDHLDAIRDELKKTEAIVEVAESHSPLTNIFLTSEGFDWKGKDPNLQAIFGTIKVSPDFGKTVGWQFTEGRDFSREFATDSSGMVLNESAVKFMGLKNPVGETVKWEGQAYNVIGVIKDVLMESPYQVIEPAVFIINKRKGNFAILKINPTVSTHEALSKIETIFKKFSPDQPFDYQFVDEEYAAKFQAEERIGKLASFFAVLAIFISCLGVFGLASFTAEQRTKEIGIRKVLGASVLNLWFLLSKDFALLVLISLFIATPATYYFMHHWLQNYQYRSEVSWWIFAIVGLGAISITLLTVSFQAIKAAVANPVNALRSE